MVVELVCQSVEWLDILKVENLEVRKVLTLADLMVENWVDSLVVYLDGKLVV